MVTYIQSSDLERIARRVWYAHRSQATRNAYGEKVASFEAMGFKSRSTEFPMRSGEWVSAGPFEIRIAYPKWDIPGSITIRKTQK
jgi:hypothetical protein